MRLNCTEIPVGSIRLANHAKSNTVPLNGKDKRMVRAQMVTTDLEFTLSNVYTTLHRSKNTDYKMHHDFRYQ